MEDVKEDEVVEDVKEDQSEESDEENDDTGVFLPCDVSLRLFVRLLRSRG